jgi:hypothetical protein
MIRHCTAATDCYAMRAPRPSGRFERRGTILIALYSRHYAERSAYGPTERSGTVAQARLREATDQVLTAVFAKPCFLRRKWYRTNPFMRWRWDGRKSPVVRGCWIGQYLSSGKRSCNRDRTGSLRSPGSTPLGKATGARRWTCNCYGRL